MRSWYLVNADEIAAENPYTFYKPSPAVIAQVRPGQVVKLIFRFTSNGPGAPSAERMWVLVDAVRRGGRFKGRLNNSPYYIKDLKLDDKLEFEACHIIHTQIEDHDNLVERYSKRCFVTNRILRDHQPVGYLYREDPDDEKDSGWRFTANDESEDYMANPDNIQYVSLGAVLNHDDSILGLLASEAGSIYVRDTITGQFNLVTD